MKLDTSPLRVSPWVPWPPTPMLAPKAAARLIGHRPGPALWLEAGRIAAQEAQPVADLRASVPFRRHLANELTQQALQAAFSNITSTQKE